LLSPRSEACQCSATLARVRMSLSMGAPLPEGSATVAARWSTAAGA
jgi:hypothetical protein